MQQGRKELTCSEQKIDDYTCNRDTLHLPNLILAPRLRLCSVELTLTVFHEVRCRFGEDQDHIYDAQDNLGSKDPGHGSGEKFDTSGSFE